MTQQHAARWAAALAALADYVAEHGHANVPARFVNADGFRLGQWLWVQRGAARRGSLSRERVRALSELGVVWEGRQSRNEQLVAFIESYADEHGSVATRALRGRSVYLDGCPVPAALRTAHRRGHLSPHLVERLERAGFVLDADLARLAHGLLLLSRFRDEHPSRGVPARYIADGGFRLGEWVRRMRRAIAAELVDADTVSSFVELDAPRSGAAA